VLEQGSQEDYFGGENWEGPPADGSEIVGWHHKLVGIRGLKSGWHVGDPGEVG